MAEKKPKIVTQDYVALVVFANDTERWMPGSKIALTDEKAAIHLALGNVLPLENTVSPVEVPPDLVVHEADAEPEPEAKPASKLSRQAHPQARHPIAEPVDAVEGKEHK